MFIPSLIFLAWLMPASLATPSQPNQCQAVDEIILLLKLDAKASSFCSSFLGIRTSTLYSLSTSILTTTDATTTPTSVTTDIVPSLTTATTTVVTGTVYTLPAVKAKRADALLSAIEKFASKDVSTACGCLSLATPTTTVASLKITTDDVTATASTSLSTVFTTTPTTTTTTIYTVTEVPYPASALAACSPPPDDSITNFDKTLFFQNDPRFDISSPESCCLLCWTTLNCVGWDHDNTSCFLIGTFDGFIGTLDGSSPQCPAGIAVEEAEQPEDQFIGVIGPCGVPA